MSGVIALACLSFVVGVACAVYASVEGDEGDLLLTGCAFVFGLVAFGAWVS